MQTLEWTSMEMLRFGNVALDVDRALLRDSKGAEVALRPKSLDLLLELARNPGRILSRDELFDAVWPDVTVTEDSIAQCVREVRRAIGDPEGRILRTIVKRGYCLDIEAQSETSTQAPDHAPDVPADQGRPSVVVLPFQSMPNDLSMDWLADGIVEEITTALSRFRSLFVIARNSAFTFKGQSVDVRDVGRRLGARYVLAGSIQRVGGQLRVTGQLVETETGSHLWADRFDGVMTDVFELQDRVTATIAGMLDHRIRRVEIDRARRKSTADLTAHDLYLRALPGFFAKTQAGYESSKQLLEEAVARDPGFAQARSMLARLAEVGVLSGWESDVGAARERAIALARETLVLDSSDPLVLARCGYVLALLGGMHLEGAALVDRAIAANPNSAEAYIRGGWVSIFNGDFAAALDRAGMCERLDPLTTFPVGSMELRAAGFFFLRRFDDAIDAAERAIGRAPHYYLARPYLAASLAHRGREPEARVQASELLRYCPRLTLAQTRRNYLFRHEWMIELFLRGLEQAGIPAG
jgi:adenylate cyclase